MGDHMQIVSYEIKFNLGIYKHKNLDELLVRIPEKEINEFENFVKIRLEEYFRRVKKESIKFYEEQLNIDKNLGLKNEEEYQRELKKLKEEERKIEEEITRNLEQNLKLEFHPKYPTLLTYAIEKITRTGWLLSDLVDFDENGKITSDRLIYHGKNFSYYGKSHPLINIWNSILLEYFKKLNRYD